MDQNLLNLIHKYAEDREIDWIAAKIIGEQQGLEFKSENDLLEWKNTVDRYLKTFEESDFDKIEETLKKGKNKAKNASNKTAPVMETKLSLASDEGYEEYGDGGYEKKKKVGIKFDKKAE